ncbi:MAG: polymorphic toxin type 17 domain-containing protein [Actinomycetota bacterium]
MSPLHLSEAVGREVRRADAASAEITAVTGVVEAEVTRLAATSWKGTAAGRFTASWAKEAPELRWFADTVYEISAVAAHLARAIGEAERQRSRAHVLVADADCFVDETGTVRMEAAPQSPMLPVQAEYAARRLREVDEVIDLAIAEAREAFDVVAEMLARGSGAYRYETLDDAQPRTNLWDRAGLVADGAGILDPTPLSDGIAGLIDLGQGDVVGAGWSVLAVIPYLDDAVAKPAKFLRTIDGEFPSLRRLAEGVASDGNAARFIEEQLGNALKHVPDAKHPEALHYLNRSQGRAERLFERHPQWMAKVKDLTLPTDGPIVFVPGRNWNLHRAQVATLNGKAGWVDAYGNVWHLGSGKAADAREWDVQVRNGRDGLGILTDDGKHLNVSREVPRGRITH